MTAVTYTSIVPVKVAIKTRISHFQLSRSCCHAIPTTFTHVRTTVSIGFLCSPSEQKLAAEIVDGIVFAHNDLLSGK